jgi:hypothetical protein
VLEVYDEAQYNLLCCMYMVVACFVVLLVNYGYSLYVGELYQLTKCCIDIGFLCHLIKAFKLGGLGFML